MSPGTLIISLNLLKIRLIYFELGSWYHKSVNTDLVTQAWSQSYKTSLQKWHFSVFLLYDWPFFWLQDKGLMALVLLELVTWSSPDLWRYCTRISPNRVCQPSPNSNAFHVFSLHAVGARSGFRQGWNCYGFLPPNTRDYTLIFNVKQLNQFVLTKS